MSDTTAHLRERRVGWAARVKLRLQTRDVLILYLLGRCGVLRTTDIVNYCFGSRSTANDRLRKLLCAGVVAVHVPYLSADNHYTLTATGREAVADAHGIDAKLLKVVRRLPRKLAHLVSINEFRLQVAKACEGSNRYRLSAFDADADLSAERHASFLELIPDARVTIDDRSTGRVHTFVFESDGGSEATTFVVRRKLAVYQRYADTKTPLFGVVDPLVLLTTPSLRRAQNIARTMDSMRVHARVVFALRPMLSAANVLGHRYALPGDLVAGTPHDDAAALFRRTLLP